MNLNQAQASFSIWNLIKKHWYIIISIILIMPVLVSMIQDPVAGSIKFTQKLLNADNLIDQKIDALRTEPQKVLLMDRPTEGHYNFFIYGVRIGYYVVFDILTNLWLIFFPLAVIYYIVSLFRMESVMKNLFYSFTLFIMYLFLSNAIFLFVSDSLIIPEDASALERYYIVFKHLLPFHGTFNLVTYLFTLIR